MLPPKAESSLLAPSSRTAFLGREGTFTIEVHPTPLTLSASREECAKHKHADPDRVSVACQKSFLLASELQFYTDGVLGISHCTFYSPQYGN